MVKAHAPAAPKYPKIIHYRGDGRFMVAGRSLKLRRLFRPGCFSPRGAASSARSWPALRRRAGGACAS
jgi:hypothetical protein